MEKQIEVARNVLSVFPPLVKLYKREVREASPRNKLTFAQFRLLREVHRGINQVGKLADHNGVSQPAMSRLVNGVVKLGLLKRVPHPSDRRQLELRLSPRGETLFLHVQASVHKKLAEQIASLSASEQKTVEEGFAKIATLLTRLETKS